MKKTEYMSIEAFQLKVKDTFENHAEKASFLMEGHRLGALAKQMACHQIDGRHRIAFDGYRLDSIRGAFNIVSQEDVEELIDFLAISKYCLPFRNGTYQKSKP